MPPRPPSRVSPWTPEARHAALLGLVWSVLMTAFYAAGIFERVDDRFLDWEETFIRSAAPGNDFALIPVEHVPSDRPWPWPRLDFALLQRGLIPEHPQSVVYESLMHDEDPRFSAFDQSFRMLLDRTGPAVFAAAALQPPGQGELPDGARLLRSRGEAGPIAAFGSFLWPVATFAVGRPVGVANLSSDPGETVRRVPLVFRNGQKLVPSLALAAAAVRIGADLDQSELIPGSKIILRNAQGRALRTIPIDDEGRLRLRSRRPGIAAGLLRIPYDDFLVYADQMERGVKPAVDLRRLAGRQVWIGATDPAVAAPVRTAAGPRPPVELQLEAAAQIVRGDLILNVPRGAVALLFLITGVLLAWAAHGLGFFRALAVVGGVTAAIFLLALGAFLLTGVHFPLLPFLVLGAGAFLSSRAAGAWDHHSHHAPADRPPRHRP